MHTGLVHHVTANTNEDTFTHRFTSPQMTSAQGLQEFAVTDLLTRARRTGEIQHLFVTRIPITPTPDMIPTYGMIADNSHVLEMMRDERIREIALATPIDRDWNDLDWIKWVLEVSQVDSPDIGSPALAVQALVQSGWDGYSPAPGDIPPRRT